MYGAVGPGKWKGPSMFLKANLVCAWKQRNQMYVQRYHSKMAGRICVFEERIVPQAILEWYHLREKLNFISMPMPALPF